MDAIIFDCDGVLVDSEVLYQEIQMAALADMGLIYEKDAYVSRFMGSGDKSYYEEVAKDYREKFARPLPDDFRPNLKSLLEREFQARLKVIADIPTMLPTLTKPMAVASSSHLAFLHKKLQQTQLHSFFGDHIYSADQVARAKPFPDLFLFTADKLNTAPEKCIVIEDSEHGVKAGLDAGMHVIGFCGGGHCNDNHAQKLRDKGAHDIAMNARELAALL